MRRFFVPPENIKNGKVIFPPDEARHLSRVLRLQIGDQVVVIDGQGKEYFVRLTTVDSSTEGEILEQKTSAAEPFLDITLAQGLPKGEKMEIVIQKCVELGVNRFIPTEMAFSVVKLDHIKAAERQKRWQRVSAESAKQAGRQVVPIVDPLRTFKEVAALSREFDLALFPYEKAVEVGIKQVLKIHPKIKKILLCVGPEGGFSSEEVELALQYGLIPVTLGQRILRTETAAIVSAALLLYEAGDLGG